MADQREFQGSLEEAIRAAIEGYVGELWTALPGNIISFNATKMTCVVQPNINSYVQKKDGTFFWAPMPPIVDVPVVFPNGGPFVITFPIQPDDECLIIFQSRCIDGWWQNGGQQNQPEIRFHDFADAMVIVGPFSQAGLIENVDTDNLQIRSVDGLTYIELAPDGSVNVVSKGGATIEIDGTTGAVTINAPGGLVVNGNLVVNGTTVGTDEGTFNSVPVSTHLHGGVQTGSGDTGPPL